VFTVSRFLGVVESILVAPPSADLWAGQTGINTLPACVFVLVSFFLSMLDEEELGFTYDFIELYTGYA
jgi:NAD+ synthase (glutamine-hydrolysing)